LAQENGFSPACLPSLLEAGKKAQQSSRLLLQGLAHPPCPNLKKIINVIILLLQCEMLNAPNEAYVLTTFRLLFLHLWFLLVLSCFLKNDFYLCVLFVLHVLEMIFIFVCVLRV
jgi:hypothetical protein